MKFCDSPLKPLSVLFVHSTSGGKSLVRDVHPVLFRGVSLTFVSVLSLGADLSMKVQQKSLQGCGQVVSIHLDKVRSVAVGKKIIDSMESLPLDTQKTIILFASPQALVEKPYWKIFVHRLIDKSMLRFIPVDEIQLFVH